MQMVLWQEKGEHYAPGVICSLYTYFLVEAIIFICARMQFNDCMPIKMNIIHDQLQLPLSLPKRKYYSVNTVAIS